MEEVKRLSIRWSDILVQWQIFFLPTGGRSWAACAVKTVSSGSACCVTRQLRPSGVSVLVWHLQSPPLQYHHSTSPPNLSLSRTHTLATKWWEDCTCLLFRGFPTGCKRCSSAVACSVIRQVSLNPRESLTLCLHAEDRFMHTTDSSLHIRGSSLHSHRSISNIPSPLALLALQCLWRSLGAWKQNEVPTKMFIHVNSLRRTSF
jgi:hypothetical protein